MFTEILFVSFMALSSAFGSPMPAAQEPLDTSGACTHVFEDVHTKREYIESEKGTLETVTETRTTLTVPCKKSEEPTRALPQS